MQYIYPKNTKLYTMDAELRFITYKYIGTKGNIHHLEYESGARFTLHDQTFNQLSLSKTMVLTEIEEKLRFKIEYIHELMRQQKVKFNPLDTADIIYILKVPQKLYEGKEVHQYNGTTGIYITTYTSAREASRILTGKEGKGNISRAIKKGQRAYGFLWSHEKLNILR